MNTTEAINQVQNGVRNWYTDCQRFADKWIESKQTFTSEELIQDFNASHNFRPAESRVWGAVVRRLIRDRRIVKAGTGTYKNPIGHCKPVNVWRVC